MTQRAIRPINQAASSAATEDLYQRHEDSPRPNELFDENGNRRPLDPEDPSQASARQEWLTLYAENGGAVEETGQGTREVGGPVEPCPLIIEFQVCNEDLQSLTFSEPVQYRVCDEAGSVVQQGTVDSGEIIRVQADPSQRYSLCIDDVFVTFHDEGAD